jgi:hypothetical protein
VSRRVNESPTMTYKEKQDMNYPLLPSYPTERQNLIRHVSNRHSEEEQGLVCRPRRLMLQGRCSSYALFFVFGTVFLVVITGTLNKQFQWYDGSVEYPTTANPGKVISSLGTTSSQKISQENYDSKAIAPCHEMPCFSMAKIHVPLGIPGFPSFLDYAHEGSINVSYDSRSLRLNGERVFFLGGSMHPSRTTQQTWNMALDQAIQNGLNLITIYVMWSDHQPFPDQDIDWSFDQAVSCNYFDPPTRTCDWSLATAIRSAADRGLFLHLRLGP